MKNSNYTIFRVDAIERYSSGRQAPVFPRLVSPPAFMYLWGVLALLITGGLILLLPAIGSFLGG